MDTFHNCMTEFAKSVRPAALEIQVRSMFLKIVRAEAGLGMPSITQAARIECYVFYKTTLILSNMREYLAALLCKDDSPNIYAPLPTREMNLEDTCPKYLEVFEEYIKLFGDQWFDQTPQRMQYFDDIIRAFSYIVSYLQAFSGLRINDNRDQKRAYSFFVRHFREVAQLKDAALRQSNIKDLLSLYRCFKPTLEKAIEILVPGLQWGPFGLTEDELSSEIQG